MAKFERILSNNPVVLKIVEALLTNESEIKRKLLEMVIEGIEFHDTIKVLEYFIDYEKELEVK